MLPRRDAPVQFPPVPTRQRGDGGGQYTDPLLGGREGEEEAEAEEYEEGPFRRKQAGRAAPEGSRGPASHSIKEAMCTVRDAAKDYLKDVALMGALMTLVFAVTLAAGFGWAFDVDDDLSSVLVWVIVVCIASVTLVVTLGGCSFWQWTKQRRTFAARYSFSTDPVTRAEDDLVSALERGGTRQAIEQAEKSIYEASNDGAWKYALLTLSWLIYVFMVAFAFFSLLHATIRLDPLSGQHVVDVSAAHFSRLPGAYSARAVFIVGQALLITSYLCSVVWFVSITRMWSIGKRDMITLRDSAFLAFILAANTASAGLAYYLSVNAFWFLLSATAILLLYWIAFGIAWPAYIYMQPGRSKVRNVVGVYTVLKLIHECQNPDGEIQSIIAGMRRDAAPVRSLHRGAPQAQARIAGGPLHHQRIQARPAGRPALVRTRGPVESLIEGF